MPRLVATRGLPGAGKTTAARNWVAQHPTRRVRVGRDDLLLMFHGRWFGTAEQDTATTVAERAAVAALLAAGYDVVCDDTNLFARYLDGLRAVAAQAGADFEVWDLTDVPVDVCVERDAARGAAGGVHIGEETIRALHAQWRAAECLGA